MARLIGVETEYAIGGRGDREVLVRTLFERARAELVHLAGNPGDLYLANGGRLYLDTGMHPELCTPECADPAEAVRYVLAGERMLEDLRAHAVRTSARCADMMIFKNNVDYTTGATWACHESYLVKQSPSHFQADLVPHLVTRIVYAGAGGFHPGSGGLDFTLSPRAWFLETVSSGSSTHHRGIFHTKDEPLARRGHHRLHVLCGESLCSHIAMYLKLGATALVVAMIEAEKAPGVITRPRDPVAALQAFAADPTCRARVAMEAGGDASALDIQREYLRAAESHLGAEFMPEWAEAVCREWRTMLDHIEREPETLYRRVDWALRRALFTQVARRYEMPWESLEPWSRLLARISKAYLAHKNLQLMESMCVPTNLSSFKGCALDAWSAEHGLPRQQLDSIIALRNELFEQDARFGELHDRGLFRALDQLGKLDHLAPGVGDIDAARTQPPRHGRARLRAEVIRDHSGDENYRCNWQGAWDLAGKRMLDLGDPFATAAEWKPYTRKDVLAQMVGQVE